MSDLKLVKFDPIAVKVDPELEAAIAFFRARHPVKTADFVAAETGISRETVAQWLKRNSRPGWRHVFALIAAYGPEFLAAVYQRAPRWIDGAARQARQQALEAQLAATQAEIDDLRPQHERMDAARESRRGGGAARDGAGLSRAREGAV
jgi:transcriptional regulator with XRE-family HTH domain